MKESMFEGNVAVTIIIKIIVYFAQNIVRFQYNLSCCINLNEKRRTKNEFVLHKNVYLSTSIDI